MIHCYLLILNIYLFYLFIYLKLWRDKWYEQDSTSSRGSKKHEGGGNEGAIWEKMSFKRGLVLVKIPTASPY